MPCGMGPGKSQRSFSAKTSSAYGMAVKSLRVSVDALAPSAIVLATEYPPLHVLGLDDEDAEDRNQYVVDLGRAAGGWNDDVIDSVVNGLVQAQPHAKRCQLLSEPALE